MNQCEISLRNDCLKDEVILISYSVDRCVSVCKSAFGLLMALCFENELLQYLGFCQLYLVSAKVNVYDPLNYIIKTNCVSVFFLF